MEGGNSRRPGEQKVSGMVRRVEFGSYGLVLQGQYRIFPNISKIEISLDYRNALCAQVLGKKRL